tara:strand:- start:1953 stop:3041 length:1089 start_codon:yes stop_codon:yes gene_type:complete
MTETLQNLLISRIQKTRPISLAEFMAEALHNKNFDYYAIRDPLIFLGDFTTAPEISQIFGELIELWVLHAHKQKETDGPVSLVELGPGRGTLMSDILRVLLKFENIKKSFEINLVEANPILRRMQQKLLGDIKILWHDDLSTLPDRQWFLVTNEFLDTLPLNHLTKNGDRWTERLISYYTAKRHFFGTSTGSPYRLSLLISDQISSKAPNNALLEFSPATLGILKIIADNTSQKGGAALLIDYGYIKPSFKSSIQAVHAHKMVNPLSNPGTNDTCHVDFQSILHEPQFFELNIHEPISQREFLRAMGINERAKCLKHGSSIQQINDINVTVKRLTNREEMGELSKVIGNTPKNCPASPGFMN